MGTTPDRLPPGPLTYEDYVELPDDGKRYEILDGELFVSPAPTPRHQRVLFNLASKLREHARDRQLGEILVSPIDLILAPTIIAQPDILFIRVGRESSVTERAIEAAPELVIEILSPSTGRRDRTTKAKLYARFGVPYYWLLDPGERTFEGYRLADGEYRVSVRKRGDQTVSADPFPELTIMLGELWA